MCFYSKLLHLHAVSRRGVGCNRQNSWLPIAAPLQGKTTASDELQRSQCTEETSLPGQIYLPACPPSAFNNVCSDFQPKVTRSTRAPLHFQSPLPQLVLTYQQDYLLKSAMWSQPAQSQTCHVFTTQSLFYESSTTIFRQRDSG